MAKSSPATYRTHSDRPASRRLLAHAVVIAAVAAGAVAFLTGAPPTSLICKLGSVSLARFALFISLLGVALVSLRVSRYAYIAWLGVALALAIFDFTRPAATLAGIPAETPRTFAIFLACLTSLREVPREASKGASEASAQRLELSGWCFGIGALWLLLTPLATGYGFNGIVALPSLVVGAGSAALFSTSRFRRHDDPQTAEERLSAEEILGALWRGIRRLTLPFAVAALIAIPYAAPFSGPPHPRPASTPTPATCSNPES